MPVTFAIYSSDNYSRLGAVIRIALAGVLFFSAFAIGAVHGWASAVMEICLWGLSLAWFVGGSTSSRPPRAFVLMAVALCHYLALQVMPVSESWLDLASPATAELHRRTAVETGSVSLYPFATRADLLRYLAYGLALWLAATLSVPIFLLRSAVVTGIAVALIALVQLLTWNGHLLWFFDPYDAAADVYYPRMTGPFVSPDHFASFLAMSLSLGGGLLSAYWVHEKPRARRTSQDVNAPVLMASLIALGLAVMIAALIGSASRGGIIGATLGLTVLWLGMRRKRANRHRERQVRNRKQENTALWLRGLLRRIGPASLAATIIIAGFLYAGPRARSLLDFRIAQAVFGNDIEGRMMLWMQSLPMLRDFPLFGVGLGCWRELFRRYEHYPMIGYAPNHTHNDYIEWCTEVGLVGVALTLALAWAFVRWARGNRSIPRSMCWGILGGIVAVAWHEIVDFNLRIPANALLLSILLGLLCNENWRDVSSPRDLADMRVHAPEPRRGVVKILGALLVFAALTAASVGQFREFRQWLDVRNGSTSLRFAPANGDTWLELGKRLYQKGLRYDPTTAAAFRAAIDRQPTSGEAFWGLSLTATTYAAKLRYLETALYLDPTRAPWRLAYANILDVTGRHADALRQVEEAVYRDPRLSSHPYLDPSNKGLREPLLESAERGFRRALADRPADPGFMSEIASFYARFGIWGDAARLWVDAAERSGDWAGYGLRAAGSFARVENYARAEELIRKAIDDAPERIEGYRLLALSVYRPQKMYAEAEEILDRGLHRSRDPAPLYVALYELRMGQKDRKGALEVLAKAADLSPRDAGLQAQLGRAYLEAEDYHRAKISFDRALRLEPQSSDFYYQRGIACERLYDLGGAREAFAKALALTPANATYQAALARVESAFEDRDR